MTDKVVVEEQTEDLPQPPTKAFDDPGLGQAAAKDLENMTPEGYLELVTYLKALEAENDELLREAQDAPPSEAAVFTEAPGCANMLLYGTGGRNVQLTSRLNDPFYAFQQLALAVVKIKDRFKDWSDLPPQAPVATGANLPPTMVSAPAPPPQIPVEAVPLEPVYTSTPVAADEGQPGIEVFEVTSLVHVVSDKGNHSLKVKGGKYQKWGQTCWPEQVPAEAAGFEGWPVGQEFAPPATMKFAWFDAAARRLISFAGTMGG